MTTSNAEKNSYTQLPIHKELDWLGLINPIPPVLAFLKLLLLNASFSSPSALHFFDKRSLLYSFASSTSTHRSLLALVRSKLQPLTRYTPFLFFLINSIPLPCGFNP